ncbi:MAG: phosphoglycerate dehydrogenase [Firmicutes bacterium]|nr:phosphoglycerate dehydrogenase [Bacillota bacterium]
MYNIATLNKISPNGLSLLTEDYRIISDVSSADGIVVRSQNMKDMTFSDNLLGIARAGIGVNNIDTAACAEKGIVVFNTPGANANAVKELVFGGMIAASRNIISASEWVRKLEAGEVTIAKQVENGKSQFKGKELKGKTLGVIGLGSIGGPVANAAVRLGMKVIGYDAYLSVRNALNLSHSIRIVTDLKEMLPEVDFLTIHVHANKETNGMINAETFDELKSGCVLINYARGSIVDFPSLKKALEYGIVSKYVCDFPDEDVLTLDNTIITPHIGASTDDAEDNCAEMAVTQLMDYIEHGNIKNSVNFPSIDMGCCKSESRIAIMHRNIPQMIGQITNTITAHNISDLTNRSREGFAYTMLDLDSKISHETIEALLKIEGVIRVRIIKA